MAGRDSGYRPVDLARMIGVSAQQIRNYVDAGILPPAERTPAGYRRFDERHRAALLAYRALARGYGWNTAREILREVHAGDVPRALALVDASHAALHEERRSLRSAGEAVEAVARREPDTSAVPRTGLRVGELAALLGVRASTLRVWDAAGLLTPRREPGTGYRRYGSADLRDAQMIKMLRRGRHPLAQIRTILDGLRRTGSVETLRAAIAQRQAALTQRSRAMLDGAGHLHRYLDLVGSPTSGPGDEPGRDDQGGR
ncbi:DNA-binding transcriptional regulator, MerR family [Streptoalloteichus tenebrarius]|uniref:DNA-binding transcriptional regulator, MerR family n=1 Tax=Streptoalloteichus tenebrarius (strain ATCC 17920 / DSM 40477 / JCM 4838 / CBS 697.72 / NBRC 16177 / NCIMB 11028 / NRRL B-12390 / A12253. 1 / ISP 5477) TaxID=1933 RepID=A0ABT1HLZ2_STRSD|nr:MerR family transcriptional regulator [Streptoalloteichus tenebrarius]MCP2256531.1 DNA-binding transcriptional regulator, MerR family [Streptoalloteichus tenebrarius]BFF04884.1 MerR family transcriptional regulator [Streptoalloteichus tenebrarius]